MVSMKLFVEGGGDSNDLRTDCRAGFAAFLKKAGLSGVLPRIVACGSRVTAYEDFCNAVANGQRAMLLVDSEAAVSPEHQSDEKKEHWQPWAHLAQRQDRTLKIATARCKTKAEYGKGKHSFKLLALIDPAKVTGASGWAKRFIDELINPMER